MAIPSYITDTLSSVAGEFANTEGPFMEPIAGSFDTSLVPDSILTLPSDIQLPSINQFQGEMMKTILGESGRAELFKNPFSDDLVGIRDKLNKIRLTPGADGLLNPLAASCTDLLQTLDHFEDHTDRLSGVVEPDANTAQYPTLEKALSVGSSLNNLHQILDSNPTNAPGAALFGSLFVGKDQISRLKDILSQPDSLISSADLGGISNTLITSAQNDVKNYTVGIKKLKRAGIASIAFGAKDSQLGNGILDMVTTSFTKGLFQNDENQRNAEESARTTKRLEAKKNGKINTNNFVRDFKTMDDLFKVGGIFEGIPLTVNVWQRIVHELYSTVSGLDTSSLLSYTQEQLDAQFSTDRERGAMVFGIFKLNVAKTRSWRNRGDVWVDGALPLGSLSRYVFAGNWNNLSSTNTYVGPMIHIEDNKLRMPTPSEITAISDAIQDGSRAEARKIKNASMFFYGATMTLPTWQAYWQFPLQSKIS